MASFFGYETVGRNACYGFFFLQIKKSVDLFVDLTALRIEENGFKKCVRDSEPKRAWIDIKLEVLHLQILIRSGTLPPHVLGILQAKCRGSEYLAL